MIGKLKDYFRMWVWAALAILALLVIGRPEQVLVLVHKGSLVFIAAFVGYWVDRNLFGETAALGRLLGSTRADFAPWIMMRRATIVSAVILAFALGL